MKRFAYIFKYTVAHADYIMQLVKSCKELRELIARPTIEVACLGGRPGSDFLGILKYMMQAGIKDSCFTCYLFDKERAWGDSWSDVARLHESPFRVYPVFQQMDVTDPQHGKATKSSCVPTCLRSAIFYPRCGS